MRFKSKSIIVGIALVIFGAMLFVSLAKVFAGDWVLSQFFSVGPLTVRFYGIIVALAALAAYLLAKKRSLKYGINHAAADNMLLFVLVGGFIGARVYHVLSDVGYYFANPLLVPAVWRGGLSIFGAFIGGVIAVWVYYRFAEKLTTGVRAAVFNTLDWLVPSLVLGQIIGRFGNLFNYEAYGYPTNLWWKMFVPPQFRIPPFETYEFFHPLFLYESLANVVIFIVLMRLSPKLRSGQLFFLWLILYNAVRLWLESLRIDSVFIRGFRLNMIVASVLILIGISCLQHFYDKKNSSNN